MEKLLNLSTTFGTDNIKCAFFDDKIMFAISSKRNLFELGSLYTPLTNFQNIKIFNELISIYEMIDYLKLN